MEQKKNGNRWIALVVCLLMLSSLFVPFNVQEANAAESKLQNPRQAADGTVTWDCITFGHYPQGAYNPQQEPSAPKEEEVYTDIDAEKTRFVYVENPDHDMGHYYKIEPIKWRVLSINKEEALLLADKVLENGFAYHNSYTENVTWEKCTIRSWLNGYGSSYNQDGRDYATYNFIDKAFADKEQEAILEKTISNADSPVYGIEGGADTKDKVFLLSMQDITNPLYGFISSTVSVDSRTAVSTAYMVSKDWWIFSSYEGKNRDYWLRSPGSSSVNASFVGDSGIVSQHGEIDIANGVRPAVHLNLNSDVWDFAGTATSNNRITEDLMEEESPNTTPAKPVTKLAQTITAKSFTKTYGNKPFSLGAKAKTKLTYKSSNTKVATVSSTGKVTLKGPGKATITITAAANGNYNAATKRVTITVKPKKLAAPKVKSTRSRTLKVSWKRDTKATGYQVIIAQNSKFKKGKKTATITKNKTTGKTFKKLKRKKTYYAKVRAYKKVGRTKLYGSYSKVKKVRVR